MIYKYVLVFSFLLLTFSVNAEMLAVNNTKVDEIVVNGGSDTANPGVTCIRVTSQISSQCVDGYIGIPNNNAQLISAALAAKASGKDV